MNVKVRKKKGKGWLEVYLWLRLPNGEKYEEKRKSPVESKSGAMRWGEARLQHIASHWQEFSREELDKQKHLEPKASVPTVKEFGERFIRDYAEANRQKPSTIEAKKSIMKNHLVPMFADVPLDRVTTLQVQELKGKLSHRSPKTVNNVLNTLSVMLGCAVKWGVIERKPCHIELIKSQSPEMSFYDLEEHKRLVEVAAELDERIHLLVVLGCDAGLRCGEIVALEWADIDFKRNVINVSRAERQGKVSVPKSGKSRRVPMTRTLARLLKQLQHLRGPRVLWREDGIKKLERPQLRKWLSRAQHKAGLRDNGGLHIMRHTFCSHLAMQGVPVNAIKELAGHSDIKTTMRYMHLSPAAREMAVQALDHRDDALQKQRSRGAFGDMLETGTEKTRDLR
jgi:integrase